MLFRSVLAAALRRGEGPHEPDIADDIGEISGHCGSTHGEAIVQRAAAGGQPSNDGSEDHRDGGQRRGQVPIDDTHNSDTADHRGGRRDRVPRESAFDAERRVSRCGYAGRQRAGKAVCEIARPVTRQMAEKVATQITGDADEGPGSNPAGQPP